MKMKTSSHKHKEVELQPKFISKMKKIKEEKVITIGSINEFKRKYGV